MNIKLLAEKNRLKCRQDDCGEMIIPGKRGQIFDFGDGSLGVIVSTTPKKWGNARRAFEAAGMVIRLDGDFEGSATFSVQNREHLRLAMRYACIKRRRVVSPEQIERLRRLSEAACRTRAGVQG